MTSKLDVYKAFYNASWANPPASLVEAGMTYLSEDFQSLDNDGKVLMDREMFLGMGQLLMSAFSDFKWVLNDIHEEDDGVVVTGHFEGVQTGDLDLSAVGAGVVPASGKLIVWPEAAEKFSIVGDKIVSSQVIGKSGGMDGFLEVLGVTPPSM